MMISVVNEIFSLKNQEQRLQNNLDILRASGSQTEEQSQLDKKLAQISRKRENLESLAYFAVGMPVHRANSKALGIVTELQITPGGLAQVWVSWDGKVQIPEQPNLLNLDTEASAQIIQVGDRITIGNGHVFSGQTFTVAQILARGWVRTTDDEIFPRECWQKIETQVSIESDEHKASCNDSTRVTESEVLPMVEESSPEEFESIVAVETPASTHEIEELTPDEQRERHRLELKVERAFYESAQALRQLRDKRLYRSTHKTFEVYCYDRFGFQRAHSYRLIEAAKVLENLSCGSDQSYLSPNGRQILPTSERQVRDLSDLEPDEQRQVWREATSGGKVPSGRLVKGIVERLKQKPLRLASNFCQIGDVFILTRLESNERKYNGCWAITNELKDFTVVVDVHDTQLVVKPENLKPIDEPDACRQLPAILSRIKRLRSIGLLDRGAYTILDSLGRQTYLTSVEEKILSCLEEHYGVQRR